MVISVTRDAILAFLRQNTYERSGAHLKSRTGCQKSCEVLESLLIIF